MLATRADPPLPLARLRARGQLVELRAADLRFTPAEAAAFLARALPAPPAPETVDAADRPHRGVGGRAAPGGPRAAGPGPGRGRGAAPAAGRQPLLMDYLLEEVFERQPAALQDFLLRTAVPERLCAPLCDALLAAGPDLARRPSGDGGRGGGRRRRRPGRAWRPCWAPTCSSRPSTSRRPPPRPAPARPRRRPGGRGSAWYRYHQLFRDLCSASCASGWGPAAERALHARAGAWFAGAGMVEEGVHHLLAAGDAAAAAALVERHAPALLEEEWPAVERWLGPAAGGRRSQRRPALLVARARVAQRRGRVDALPALVAAAQAALDAPPAGAPLGRRRRIAPAKRPLRTARRSRGSSPS